MDGSDDTVWRSLARIYTVVLACGVCVPVSAALPVLVGFESLATSLLFGAFGLAVAAGVTFAVDARFDAVAVRPAPDGPVAPGESTRG